jgi:hypothetical protein
MNAATSPDGRYPTILTLQPPIDRDGESRHPYASPRLIGAREKGPGGRGAYPRRTRCRARKAARPPREDRTGASSLAGCRTLHGGPFVARGPTRFARRSSLPAAGVSICDRAATRGCIVGVGLIAIGTPMVRAGSSAASRRNSVPSLVERPRLFVEPARRRVHRVDTASFGEDAVDPRSALLCAACEIATDLEKCVAQAGPWRATPDLDAVKARRQRRWIRLAMNWISRSTAYRLRLREMPKSWWARLSCGRYQARIEAAWPGLGQRRCVTGEFS